MDRRNALLALASAALTLPLPALGAKAAASAERAHHARARAYFTDTRLLMPDNKPVRFYSDVLQERVVLMSFIYTHCGDACPMIMHKLGLVRRELGEHFGRDVRFVTLSVDPERDTPLEMGRFAAKFQATHPEWIFLTGPKVDIDRVLKKLGAWTDDPRSHFTGIILGDTRVDRWRKVRPDAPPQAIAAELRMMLAAPLADAGK